MADETRETGGHTPRDRALEWGAAVCLPVAFCLGHVATVGAPNWSDWEHQPFWLAAFVTLGGLARAWRPARVAGTIASCALATTCVAWLVIWPGVASEWSDVSPVWRELTRWGLIAFVFAALSLTQRLARRLGRVDGPAMLGVVSVGLGAIALASGYAKFVFLAGVLGALAVVAWIAILLARSPRLPSSFVLGHATILFGVLAGVWFHTLAGDRSPAAAFVALALAPLAGIAGELGDLRSRPRARAVVRIAAVTVVVAIVVAIVVVGMEGGEDAVPYDFEW